MSIIIIIGFGIGLALWVSLAAMVIRQDRAIGEMTQFLQRWQKDAATPRRLEKWMLKFKKYGHGYIRRGNPPQKVISNEAEFSDCVRCLGHVSEYITGIHLSATDFSAVYKCVSGEWWSLFV